VVEGKTALENGKQTGGDVVDDVDDIFRGGAA